MGNNITLEAQRKRFKKALHRVEVARKWEKEGYRIEANLKDLNWQLRQIRRRWGTNPKCKRLQVKEPDQGQDGEEGGKEQPS